MFEICCFWMTMTIWVVSSHSNSQEKSLIRDTQEVIIGKVIIINVLGGDSDVCNLLFLDDHDPLTGGLPLQQPGEEPDQGHPQDVILGKR